MKNNDNSTELKEIPIPEYPSMKERLGCSRCLHYNNWSSYSCDKRSRKNSWFACYRNYNKITIPKFVISLIIFILAIVYNFIYFSSFWTSVIYVSIVAASIISFDILSEVILAHLFLHIEKQKEEKYDSKVKEIETHNKIIRKKQLGISDEYEAFIDNSKAILSSLQNVFSSIKTLFDSPSKVEERIIQKFENMLEELESLSEKLSIYNYEDSTLVPIYTVYLPRLKENSNYLMELSNKDKLTEKQEIEFSNLLEVFRKKLEDENSYLDHKLEEDFIIKMEALNKDLLPEYNGGEDS